MARDVFGGGGNDFSDILTPPPHIKLIYKKQLLAIGLVRFKYFNIYTSLNNLFYIFLSSIKLP